MPNYFLVIRHRRNFTFEGPYTQKVAEARAEKIETMELPEGEISREFFSAVGDLGAFVEVVPSYARTLEEFEKGYYGG